MNVIPKGKLKITKKTDGGELIISGNSRLQVRLPLALGVELRGTAHTAATSWEFTR